MLPEGILGVNVLKFLQIEVFSARRNHSGRMDRAIGTHILHWVASVSFPPFRFKKPLLSSLFLFVNHFCFIVESHIIICSVFC